jgi:hypothetical protein
VRHNRPFVFTDLLRQIGVPEVIAFLEKHGGIASCNSLEY